MCLVNTKPMLLHHTNTPLVTRRFRW